MTAIQKPSSGVPSSLLYALNPALDDMDHRADISAGTAAAAQAPLPGTHPPDARSTTPPLPSPPTYTAIHPSSIRSLTDEPYACTVHSPPESPPATPPFPREAPKSGPYLNLPSAQTNTSLLSPSALWVSESDLTTLYVPSSPGCSSVSDMDEKASFFAGVAKEDDGIYIDRPPDLEKLNEEQRAIAAEYAPDLDKEQKSLVRTLLSTALDWRKYVRWQYWRTSIH
ncbi:hypothetical protein CBS14141_002945 [Malassezia furfur]|nr:hypothetical protein CBS14141_002945 [Malassezia furfur]